MDFSRVTARLKERFGNSVSTDEETCFRFSFDGSKLSFIPAAVFRPANNEELGEFLQSANEHRVPVTTRGAGSSLTGSASPLRGGWVLDLTHWKEIRVDRLTGMAYVQCGALNGDVQREAERLGWFYPPDPSSREFSTIGGNIACNAGGLRCVKYGVTRDYILALKGFLPTGEAVSWSRDLRKYAAGYNIRDLWIGSEGTLGVITEAVLRLIPKPETRWTFLAGFADETEALEAVKILMGERLVPSILEFLDRESVSCAESATGRAIFDGQRGNPVLLVELDGHPAVVAADRLRVLEWGKRVASAWREAATAEEAELLWEVRRKCSGAMFELGDSKLNEDVVVPLEKQVELLLFLRELIRETQLAIATFGHAGDGNFHVNIMFNREDTQQAEKAQRAVYKVMEKVLSLGGTISGEHGIGLAKTPFFAMEHGAAEIRAMKAIKMALDPNGILNPGKIFDVFEVWKERPVRVRLPWDHR